MLSFSIIYCIIVYINSKQKLFCFVFILNPLVFIYFFCKILLCCNLKLLNGVKKFDGSIDLFIN